MTNREKFDELFRRNFMLSPQEALEELDMMNVPCWNSFEHFTMINDVENTFSIGLNEEEMMSFTSYRKGLEILERHGLQMD